MPEKKLELSQYRLSQSAEDLQGAEKNLAIGEFKIASNRAYYSVFHAMRAILALDGVDFKKHSGVISYFRENYIKSDIFETKYSKIITSASLVRNKCDYEDFYTATKEEAEEQIANAREFLKAVTLHIDHTNRQRVSMSWDC